MTPESLAFHLWRPAAWLRVAGEDAFSFLQGQFTNDLRALEKIPAVYGLWLNAKGRVIADSFVLRGPAKGEFYVGSYFSSAQSIRERLESYIIADDVTLEDETPAWFGITVPGALAELPARNEGEFVFPARRGLAGYVERLTRTMPAVPADARSLSTDEMERNRIVARIPAVPLDIGPADLPNEGELEKDAVSYDKGCYLGQEVMARLRSMGQVRRRLLKVVGTDAPPHGPCAMYQGAKHVGELRSAIADGNGFVGLALLSVLHLKPDAPLSLAADGPGRAQVVAEAKS
jgi:folate-binding protein YgfZ